MEIRENARSGRAALLAKRVLDLSIAVPACLALAPLFALIAAAIKLDSPGPVFFARKRWGRDRVPFTMLVAPDYSVA